jgi:hypothetical protein
MPRTQRDRWRMIAPHVFPRLFGHAGDDPLVFARHGVNPRAGGAALRQNFDDAGEQSETRLDTAEAKRLHDAEDAGAVEIRDGFIGNMTGGHRRLRPRRQYVDHGPRGIDKWGRHRWIVRSEAWPVRHSGAAPSKSRDGVGRSVSIPDNCYFADIYRILGARRFQVRRARNQNATPKQGGYIGRSGSTSPMPWVWHPRVGHGLTRRPSCRSTRPREPVAQLVEHETFNLGAVGSSPTGLTMGAMGFRRALVLDRRAVPRSSPEFAPRKPPFPPWDVAPRTSRYGLEKKGD